MNCRKCGYGLSEVARRCPICDAIVFNQASLFKVIGVLAVLAVFGGGFLLFNSSGINLLGRFSAPSDPNLWDFGASEIAFINQTNQNARHFDGMPIFMSEAGIYMSTNRGIIRTTDYFETYEFIDGPEELWLMSIHISPSAIYYTTWREYETDYPSPHLYRYDIQTGISSFIATDIFSKVIVDELVFHQTDAFEAGLYLLNMNTDERTALVDRPVYQFFVDSQNERLFFGIGDGGYFYQSDLDGTNQEELLVGQRLTSFAFNGDVIAVSTRRRYYPRNNYFYILDGSADVQAVIQHDFDITNVFFVGNYVLSRVRADNGFASDLYLFDLDDLDSQWIFVRDVRYLAGIGNYIVYNHWDDDGDIYRMSLRGRSDFIRPMWYGWDD